MIQDEYALAKGTGVAFYWQTELPCSQEGQRVRIIGDKGTALLSAPPDCDVRIDELPMAGDKTHNRIAIIKNATEGTLTVEVSLAPKE